MFLCWKCLFVSSMFVCRFVVSLASWTRSLFLCVRSVCLSVVCLLVGSVCCKSLSLDSMLMFVCRECLFVSSIFVCQQGLL